MSFEAPIRLTLPKDAFHAEGGLQGVTALNATTTRFFQAFQATHTANAISLFIRLNAVTTPANLKVGLQALSGVTPSNPTGTWLGATNSGFGVITPAANTTYEVTLGETVSLVAGESYGIVIEWDSTAGAISLVRSITYTTTSLAPHKGGLNTYFRAFTSGAWSGASVAGTGSPPCFGVRTDAAHWWMDGFALPAASLTFSNSITTNTTPDESGNRIYLPDSSVVGLWVVSSSNGAADLVLYDDSNNVVVSRTLNQNVRSTTNIGGLTVPVTPVAVSAGWYRVVLKPTSTSVLGRNFLTYTSNAMNGRHMRDKCYLTTRTDGGAWTDSLDSLMLIGVEIEPTLGSGGGNVIVIEE